MKRQIITLVLAFMAMLTVTAQKKVVVVIDGKDSLVTDVWRVDEIKFIDGDVVKLTDTPDTVDLGLSVRWADRNMGAATPKEPGLLIGWGDTTLTNLSKKLQYFPIEAANEDIIGGNYDVATQKWDDKWRMPSMKEMQELIDSCLWIWNADSMGYDITRKGYEGHLFLPVTGRRVGMAEAADGQKGFYWTGSIGRDNQNGVSLSFAEDEITDLIEQLRYLGLAIRPVTGPAKIPVKIESIDSTSVSFTTADIVATLTGGLEDASLVGIAYGTSPNGLTPSDVADDSHKISKDVSGTVTFQFTNLQMHTKYYAMVYVKTSDGYVKSGVISFTTLARFPVADAVDLDLPSGIKWASWNIGSSSPLDVPSDGSTLFGWGDPNGDVRSLAIGDNPYYKDCDVDDKSVNIAGTKYDIATVQWGKGWQLPTTAQFRELITNCEMKVDTYTYLGKTYRAYKIWSKKNPNKFIYLPEAGLRNSRGEYKQVGNGCYYWTAINNGAGSANYAIPSQGSVSEDHLMYVCLLAIRPIYVESEPTVVDTDKPLTDAGKAAKYVDLGVSVKWATYNVGTTSEVYTGDYFSWADTVATQTFSKEANTFYNEANPEGAKLDVNSLELNGTELPMKFDAASSQWGGKWRLPTKNEWNELVNSCDWVWKGNGYRIYKKGSTKDSESIFLPTTGFKSTSSAGVTQTYSPTTCQYWSGDINGYYGAKGQEAMCFKGDGDSNTKNVFSAYREYGLCIRPVWSK